MSRLVWWLRRDLRLDDNMALASALTDADEVIPVFVLDDRLLASSRVQGPRIAWMLDGLRVLDSDLRRYGSSLVIRRGRPASELLVLCRESQAKGVYFNRDYNPYAAHRDQAVIQTLKAADYSVTFIVMFRQIQVYDSEKCMAMASRQPEMNRSRC